MVVPSNSSVAEEGHDTETAGGEETVRLTGPTRPARLLRVTLPLPVGLVKETDEAEILKSEIMTWRPVEWLRPLPVPVNVTR